MALKMDFSPLGERDAATMTEMFGCVPSTCAYVCNFEIVPAVEPNAGVQEESRLVFPEVMLQVEPDMISSVAKCTAMAAD